MKHKNSKIKLIILDAYGPVITGGYQATCKFLAKKFKIPPTPFTQRGHPKKSPFIQRGYAKWEDLYNVIYKKYFNMAAERKITQQAAWKNAIKELNLPISVKEAKAIHYSLMGLNMKVLDFIKKLNKDTKILLLSKNTRSQFSDVNNKLNFRGHFKYVINTWELGLPKASKETLRYIMKKFKIKTGEIIYADDQLENLTEAKKIGIKTIFYKNFEQFKKEMINYLK